MSFNSLTLNTLFVAVIYIYIYMMWMMCIDRYMFMGLFLQNRRKRLRKPQQANPTPLSKCGSNTGNTFKEYDWGLGSLHPKKMGEDGGGLGFAVPTSHQGELDGKTVAIKPNEVLCAWYMGIWYGKRVEATASWKFQGFQIVSEKHVGFLALFPWLFAFSLVFLNRLQAGGGGHAPSPCLARGGSRWKRALLVGFGVLWANFLSESGNFATPSRNENQSSAAQRIAHSSGETKAQNSRQVQ